MSADNISAVVLAGTHDWSGSSFERLAPRPLLPVAQSPLLSYSLRWLRDSGVRRATICANGTTQLIEADFGNGGDLEMDLSYYKDATPRGPAGCVRDAGERSASQTLVVTDGTAIPTVDLAPLLASHHSSGAALTVVVRRERSALATPTGVYVFERRALEHAGGSGFQDIKENLIPRLHRAGELVVAHETDAPCPHVFDAPTYLAVNYWALQRLAREEAGAGGSLMHPSACVEPGARLVGPVQLGPGVLVKAGATLVGPTSVGAFSTVERDALVARSVVWSRCVIGERAVVHGSVVGHDAVVAATTCLFNVVRPPRTAPRSQVRSLRGQGPTTSRVAPPPANPSPDSTSTLTTSIAG